MPKERKIKRPSKDQVEHLRIALGMSGVATNNMTCEIIILVQRDMRKLGGKFSLRDAARITAFVEEQYKSKSTGDVKPK